MFKRESSTTGGRGSGRGPLASGHTPAGRYAKRVGALDLATPAHPHTSPELLDTSPGLLADLLTGPAGTSVGFDTPGLQSALGNRRVQSLLQMYGEAPETAGGPCTCGGTCSHCSGEGEELMRAIPAPIPETGPSDGELDEEELNKLMPPQTFTEAELGAEMTPRAFSETELGNGGGVRCQDGLMVVNIGPGIDPCIESCARRHEEKHIADFVADPVYKDACKGITNGKTFRYLSNDDACRFETAATDVEIACLESSLPGPEACRSMRTTRKDKTLPDYKKSVCGGC